MHLKFPPLKYGENNLCLKEIVCLSRALMYISISRGIVLYYLTVIFPSFFHVMVDLENYNYYTIQSKMTRLLRNEDTM